MEINDDEIKQQVTEKMLPFGAQFRYARKNNLKFTQAEAAAAIGLEGPSGAAVISAMEQGKSDMKVSKMIKLAALIGCDVSIEFVAKPAVEEEK